MLLTPISISSGNNGYHIHFVLRSLSLPNVRAFFKFVFFSSNYFCASHWYVVFRVCARVFEQRDSRLILDRVTEAKHLHAVWFDCWFYFVTISFGTSIWNAYSNRKVKGKKRNLWNTWVFLWSFGRLTGWPFFGYLDDETLQPKLETPFWISNVSKFYSMRIFAIRCCCLAVLIRVRCDIDAEWMAFVAAWKGQIFCMRLCIAQSESNYEALGHIYTYFTGFKRCCYP